MNRLSICILSVDHLPQYLGGIKRVTSILGAEWIKKDIDVCYLTVCSSTLHEPIIKGIPQYFFPNPSNIFAPENISFFEELKSQRHIHILLNPHVEDQDITELSFIIKKRTKIKLVSILHFSPNHHYDITRQSFFNNYALRNNPSKWCKDILLWSRFHLYKGKQIKKFQQKWRSKVIGNSDRYVVLSEQFLHYFDPKEKACISYINNPTDCIEYSNKELSKEKKIVWCGRMDVNGMKRVDRMLRIWKKISPIHPDWKLQLLGSGDYDYIKKLIDCHCLKNIEIIGFCNAYEYYKKASIVAMTSTTEGWGMVLVEAQQFGCVPIAFKSYDSITDIIEDGKTGFLIRPFDTNKYADALHFIINHPEIQKDIREAAMASVKKFNSSIIAQQWIDLFHTL